MNTNRQTCPECHDAQRGLDVLGARCDMLAAALRDAEFLLRKVSANWKEARQCADSMARSAEDARAALAQIPGGDDR